MKMPQPKLLSETKANAVYDLLVAIGGALEPERLSFIYNHCTSEWGCAEWRFCGKLGFGGKYRMHSNRVDFYKEDETPETLLVREKLNMALFMLGHSE